MASDAMRKQVEALRDEMRARKADLFYNAGSSAEQTGRNDELQRFLDRLDALLSASSPSRSNPTWPTAEAPRKSSAWAVEPAP